MSNKFNSIKEYIVTILVSLFIAMIIAFSFEIELMFRSEKTVNFNELNVENLSKFCTIEELERQLVQNPDDIIINIRLAVMYEELGKLDKANDFYKNALKLSGRSNFAIYSYAIFCARNDLYVIAATLAEELSGNNRKTYELKARIYEQIADSLSKKENYPASVNSYQVAFKYAKSMKNFKYLAQIREKYAAEYVKLADYHMNMSEYKEAEANLKNSIKIKKNALANYKLGLVYNPNNLKLAERHISYAFSQDPFIVNPYIYHSVVQKLLDEAKSSNNQALYSHYDAKLGMFKNKLSKVYLYKNQIEIINSKIVVKKSFLGKPKYYLSCDIKNLTKDNIQDLLLRYDIFINGKKYSTEKKIINKTKVLNGFDIIENLELDLPNDLKFNNLEQNNDIFVRYYAKKCNEAPWVLIKISFLKL